MGGCLAGPGPCRVKYYLFFSLKRDFLISIGLLAMFTAFYPFPGSFRTKESQSFYCCCNCGLRIDYWGLLNVFPNFPKWGIAFGVAVAFVLGGISLAFSFVKARYGWQTIGKLPGLADPMPRFGTKIWFFLSVLLYFYP
ncbi:MAG: hypothetical protein CM1200mP16_14360 [Nitrospina sp.]|nr:MAG: hypothetical protein CM1200mP16_14360 [Nitrospina sp.]